MQYYKKLMALVIGLFLVILSGSLSAEFVETTPWYTALPLPAYTLSAEGFQICWLIVYILTAILIAETIAVTALRKNTLGWIALTLLQPIWCFLFFTLHYPVVSLVLLVIIFLLQLLLLFQSMQKKWTPLFTLPILIWYLYLITLVYQLILRL